MRFEPTPASTVVPSLLESEDITTAPLRFLKYKFHGTVLCLISLNGPSDRLYFWCACALVIRKYLIQHFKQTCSCVVYKYIGKYTVYMHINTLHMGSMRYMQNKSTCIINNTPIREKTHDMLPISVIAGTRMLEQRRINVDVVRR